MALFFFQYYKQTFILIAAYNNHLALNRIWKKNHYWKITRTVSPKPSSQITTPIAMSIGGHSNPSAIPPAIRTEYSFHDQDPLNSFFFFFPNFSDELSASGLIVEGSSGLFISELDGRLIFISILPYR